jgi:hypothetical protein
MNSNVIFLDKENQINRVIKDQKKAGRTMRVLFVSLWDKWANTLVDSLEDYERYSPLHVVNSFTMPHSFVIYNVTTTPTLITLYKDRYTKEDYLPNIYSELGCEPVTFSI